MIDNVPHITIFFAIFYRVLISSISMRKKRSSDKLSEEEVYITGKASKELETQSTALFTPQVRFSLVG